jgi:internalin A
LKIRTPKGGPPDKLPCAGFLVRSILVSAMSDREHDSQAQELARRIEEARLTKAAALDLSKLHLEGVPEAVADLADLRSLDLSGNRITALPEFITRLDKLELLDLRKNRLGAVPDFLSSLVTLEQLDLGENQITYLPETFVKLTKLLSLRVQKNRISAIPEFFADLQQLRNLVLSDNDIATIPDSLSTLHNLESLFLWGNKISAIPDSLSELSKLEDLYLGDNLIEKVPDSLARLTKLQDLDLGDNHLGAVPEVLGSLASLQLLFLWNTGISVIPDFMAGLYSLRELNLSSNEIKSIPDFFAGFTKLESLTLGGNQISTIPEVLAQITSLRKFDLMNNGVAIIPDSIAGLTKLESLDLRWNQISTVPDALARLSNLKSINLDGNPLPEELFAALRRGVPSLFRYLRASRKVYPRTVKVVLLGEPKSGKTTLLEALRGNPHPCDELRRETVGVNVVSIEKANTTDDRPIYLSAWDFAGQHMEHATHQFFMTENAIYLILWNARLGTESGRRDLWYWLELLRIRVREPKFLLVATHTEHTPPDLNLSEIERTYKGSKGNFAVDLCDLRGFAALEARILELASESPSLRAEWPAEWLSVRDAVREMRREQPHLTPTAFRKLMKKNGISEREDQDDLANQLHELGEIVYFQDRDELSKMVILDPEWVAELIALVVRSKEAREQSGILRKEDLDSLWKKGKLNAQTREHLIHLMDWFDLTYSTGHATEPGLVVEALPYSSPDDLKNIELPVGQPQMEMIFRFPSFQRHLPPGIPAWGIARAHRFSKCRPWRDAAAFEDRDSHTKSQALILASDSVKEVRLRVAADYPPFFFGRMEAILRDTFRRYPGVEPERRLPCFCRQACPNSFLFETVIKRRNEGKHYVMCDKTGEDVLIESLLSGAQRTDTVDGFRAFQSEKRRVLTEFLRALNEQMEKSCPSVFTLVPSRTFTQLDTWFDSITKAEQMELALYCEHDSGWHPTSHSLYLFTPDLQWFDSLKKHWNQFVGITKYVGPLAKTVGKATGLVWAELAGLGSEKLPEAQRSAAGPFFRMLGRKPGPAFIDIETRFLLQSLIADLDSKRLPTEPKNGGLHRYLIDDGRLLWLCPAHLKLYLRR